MASSLAIWQAGSVVLYICSTQRLARSWQAVWLPRWEGIIDDVMQNIMYGRCMEVMMYVNVLYPA